jgi:hypothetical protein
MFLFKIILLENPNSRQLANSHPDEPSHVFQGCQGSLIYLKRQF